MTTIIGIAGKDPETLESYVVLCADTRGTLSGKTIDDNEKKIFTGVNSNYALGVAGKCLNAFFSEKNEQDLYNFLNNPVNENKTSIENRLKSINDVVEEITEHKNTYFISMKEEVPKIYFFNGKELVESGAYAVIGSGMTFTSSLKALDAYKKDKQIMISKKGALNFAIDAMNEASLNDDCTGGKMNVAIVTSSDIKFIPNYADIKYSQRRDVISRGEEDIHQSGIHPYHLED